MNIVQKNSKGNNPLDYPLNTIDKLYTDNKLSNFRSSNLDEFRWYRETYSAILESSLGLKRFYSLNLNQFLSLGIDLEMVLLLLEKDRTRIEYIDIISKINRVIFFDKSELTKDPSIKSHKRKRKNYLYDFKKKKEFRSWIDEKYKRSKRNLIRKLKRFLRN